MESKYQHNLYEDKISQSWLKAGAFTPAKKGRGQHFSIVLPPPNANDPLHVGHAMYTIEDILIRFHRMLGEDTLWLPGVDHAGIETQFVFEKKLQKQKQSRFQFERDKLYQLIWDYVQENADIAREQLIKLGFSLDWSRFKYTLDPEIVATVLKTFRQLAEKKLLYRSEKLVNYCPKCGTAFSDLEVKHLTRRVPLYYLKYGPFVLATTRPETKFGDTAVAVHPADPRYQRYLGQEIEVTGLLGKFKLKVIADEYVERDFGTGVVKITPYHDHNDFEVWQRHQKELPPPLQVIGFDGRLTQATGKYAGLKVAVAREVIVKDLREQGLIEKVDYGYQTQLSGCYRCQSILEPLPLAQFFIKVKPLTAPIIKKLDAGEITIYGTGYEKILRNWLTNLRDWNISRQIVWGIRLPVWYKAKENPTIRVTFLAKKLPKEKKGLECRQLASGKILISGSLAAALRSTPLPQLKAGLQTLEAPIDAKYELGLTPEETADYIQETDTFDTWFSSSQWPFATLQNSRPGDFERFYPTTVMETGYDILPFWVMRMLMVGQFATGKLPFSKVYLHGLVRDGKGQKMSKSKGNVLNPLAVVEKYGADALRFALVVRSSAGQDKSIGEGDFKAARNLTNKLWNAARFIITLEEQATRVTEATEAKGATGATKGEFDEEFSRRLQGVVKEVTRLLNDYKIGTAVDQLYDAFWHFYCDEAIEKTKTGALSPTLARTGLVTFVKLWQPILPFVTEQIWQELGKIGIVETKEQFLALTRWPNDN